MAGVFCWSRWGWLPPPLSLPSQLLTLVSRLACPRLGVLPPSRTELLVRRARARARVCVCDLTAFPVTWLALSVAPPCHMCCLAEAWPQPSTYCRMSFKPVCSGSPELEPVCTALH